MKCINMAIEMLGGYVKTDTLHPNLTNVFVQRENLCNRLGGSIRSRQIIACIIVDWCEANPTEHPLIVKKEVHDG